MQQSSRALPNHHLLITTAHHRVTGFATESLGECGHVAGRANGTEVGWCVRIGGQAHIEFLRSEVATPHGAPVEEEALVAGQAIGLGIGLALGGFQHRVIGGIDAAQVGNVFTQGEFAIDVLAGAGQIAGELSDEFVGTPTKPFGVFRCPLVFEISGGPEAAALVVVAVGHFVADDRTDAAEIGGIIRLGIEEWRLQNGRREHDFVL